MHSLLVVAVTLGTGCDPCFEDHELPASGGVRRGLFSTVQGGPAVAAADGVLAHEVCEGRIRVLDGTLAPQRELDAGLRLEDERWVWALAVDTDGTVAATLGEREYIGDIDEEGAVWLVLFDGEGRRAWKQQLAMDADTRFRRVALGPEHVFVTLDGAGEVRAYTRSTGELVWDERIGGSYEPAIAALRDGGVAVVGQAQPASLIVFAADGTERWRRTPEELGLGGIEELAVAPDGSIAVLGALEPGVSPGPRAAVLLAPDGSLRWTQPTGTRSELWPDAIATDGVEIVVAGATYPGGPDVHARVVAVTADGIRELVRATGAGTQHAYVDAITADSALVHIAVSGTEIQPTPRLEIGDIITEGDGVAFLELAR